MTIIDSRTDRIREVLVAHARLPVDVAELDEDDDLFQAGMTSHASVNVMLALEDAFDFEFPEALLRKSTFSSIGSLRRALDDLVAERAGDEAEEQEAVAQRVAQQVAQRANDAEEMQA